MTLPDEMPSWRSFALGTLAFTFFLAHLAWHIHAGDPWNALWACHVASIWIGCGGIVRRPAMVVIGLLWLAIGIPLWGIFLLGGGTLVPTSILTHFGAAAVGLVLIREPPFRFQTVSVGSRWIWWQAFAALAVLVLVTRLLTDRADNINLAFDIHGKSDTLPWEQARYLMGLAGVVATVFFASEWLLRKLFGAKDAILSDR